jgi:hypothetical protein
MKISWRLLAGFCGMSLLSFGSTIDNISVSDGSLSTVVLSTFNAYGNTMGPMVVTVNFGSGSASCEWVAATAGCGVTGQFDIGFSPAAGHTYPLIDPLGFWFIDDLRTPLEGSNNDIFSVTINTLAGNVALDRCMSSPGVFNNNNNTLFSDCDTEGTIGSNDGWTANDAPGGNNIVADVAYTNRLRTAAQNVGDLYGFMTLTFNKGNTTFDPHERFTWRMDTDLLIAPEPAAMSLVGGALLALGVIRRRKSGRA